MQINLQDFLFFFNWVKLKYLAANPWRFIYLFIEQLKPNSEIPPIHLLTTSFHSWSVSRGCCGPAQQEHPGPVTSNTHSLTDPKPDHCSFNPFNRHRTVICFNLHLTVTVWFLTTCSDPISLMGKNDWFHFKVQGHSHNFQVVFSDSSCNTTAIKTPVNVERLVVAADLFLWSASMNGRTNWPNGSFKMFWLKFELFITYKHYSIQMFIKPFNISLFKDKFSGSSAFVFFGTGLFVC